MEIFFLVIFISLKLISHFVVAVVWGIHMYAQMLFEQVQHPFSSLYFHPHFLYHCFLFLVIYSFKYNISTHSCKYVLGFKAISRIIDSLPGAVLLKETNTSSPSSSTHQSPIVSCQEWWFVTSFISILEFVWLNLLQVSSMLSQLIWVHVCGMHVNNHTRKTLLLQSFSTLGFLPSFHLLCCSSPGTSGGEGLT